MKICDASEADETPVEALWHFHVSKKEKRFSVFLTGAYENAELNEKCLPVILKKKVLSLIGYRGRKKKIETFMDLLDMEDNDFLEGSSKDEGIAMQLDQIEAISELEDIAAGDSSFKDIHEIDSEYKPHQSFKGQKFLFELSR